LFSLYVSQAAADDSIAPPLCTTPPFMSAGLVRPTCPPGETCAPIAGGEIAAQSFACGAYSDVAVAMTGMHPDKVWLTRFELNLPSTALDADCIVERAVADVEIQPFLRARTMKNPPCAQPLFSAGFGGALMALASVGTLLARRRARSGGV
jgi:hypothetical protein